MELLYHPWLSNLAPNDLQDSPVQTTSPPAWFCYCSRCSLTLLSFMFLTPISFWMQLNPPSSFATPVTPENAPLPMPVLSAFTNFAHHPVPYLWEDPTIQTRTCSRSSANVWWSHHFELLRCVVSHFSRVWLWDRMNCSPPGSSVHGILQARILEWVAMPSPRGSSWPSDRTRISYVSCISRRVLYHFCHLGSLCITLCTPLI